MGAVKASGKKGSVLPQGQLLCYTPGYRGAVDREPLCSQLPDQKGRQRWKQPSRVQVLALSKVHTAVQAQPGLGPRGWSKKASG